MFVATQSPWCMNDISYLYTHGITDIYTYIYIYIYIRVYVYRHQDIFRFVYLNIDDLWQLMQHR